MLHIYINHVNLQGRPCARGVKSLFFGAKIETLIWANIILNSFLELGVIKKIYYNLLQIQVLQDPSNILFIYLFITLFIVVGFRMYKLKC